MKTTYLDLFGNINPRQKLRQYMSVASFAVYFLMAPGINIIMLINYNYLKQPLHTINVQRY